MSAGLFHHSSFDSDSDDATIDLVGLWSMIHGALEPVVERRLRVRATIASYKLTRDRHAFFDLVQGRDVGTTSKEILAQFPAVMWSSVVVRVSRTLEREGLSQLANNLEVVFVGRLNLSERYGSMRFQVEDIDVQALRVDSMIKIAEIRAALMAEGVWRSNKELPLPTVPLRVGLVTSPVGAVKSDFERPLRQSGFAFVVKFFASSVAGQSAKVEIPQAIRDASASDCDVIVVIRGGGSAGDLAIFNDENVVRAVATAAKPVLCAIGHSTDRGSVLIDEVAHSSFDVPQSVAGALVERVGDFSDELTALAVAAVRLANGKVAAEATWADLVPSLLAARVSSLPARAHYRLDTLANRLHVGAMRRMQSEFSSLDGVVRILRRRLEGIIDFQEDQLAVAERELARVDLVSILDRGFVIVQNSAGQMVRRAKDVGAGEPVTVIFRDGTRSARIL